MDFEIAMSGATDLIEPLNPFFHSFEPFVSKTSDREQNTKLFSSICLDYFWHIFGLLWPSAPGESQASASRSDNVPGFTVRFCFRAGRHRRDAPSCLEQVCRCHFQNDQYMAVSRLLRCPSFPLCRSFFLKIYVSRRQPIEAPGLVRNLVWDWV